MGRRVTLRALAIAVACGLPATSATASLPRIHLNLFDLEEAASSEVAAMAKPMLRAYGSENPDVADWRERQIANAPAADDALDVFSRNYAATHRFYILLMEGINEFRDLAGGSTYRLEALSEEAKDARETVLDRFKAFRDSQAITAELGWALYHESFASMGAALPDETCTPADRDMGLYQDLEAVFAYHRDERRVREQFWLDEFHTFLNLNLRACPENSSFMGQCVTSWQREYAGYRGFSVDTKTGDRRDLKTVKWLFEERFLLGRPVITERDLSVDEHEWVRQHRRRMGGELGGQMKYLRRPRQPSVFH